MIRFSWFAIGIVLALLPGGGNAVAGEKIFPFAVQRTQLDNGLTIVSVEYDSPGIIAYYTVVRTGSRNEVEEGLSGFAHFFEHMMFRGTPRFSEGKYNEVLKGLGADSNAFTTDDWTCYHITVSSAALPTVVDLESDRFQNLKYDKPGFQKEARAVLGEYNKSASSPFMILDEKMQDTAFTRHTYKHTTIGFLKDIVDMPNQYEYSLKFFDRWYRPENCVVLVVGDVDHKWLVELAKRHYGPWKPGTARIEIPQEPPQESERTVDLTWNGQTLPYLYIGYHVPGFDAESPDVAALDVLGEALFSETSPLFEKLVLQERKVEFIQGGAAFRRDPTLFTIAARITSEEHIASVREEITKALQQAAKEPIAEDRLATIKSHLRYSFAMSLDTPDAVARMLGEFLQLTGDVESVNQLYETYDAVTVEDVQRVAARYFQPRNRTTLTLRQAAGDKQESSPGSGDCGERGPAPDCGPIAAPAVPSESAATAVPAADRIDPTHDTLLLNKKSPLVSLRILYRTGSINDPPGKEGLATLTARLLAEGGTKRYSYQQILKRLYPIAAQAGVHTDKELTVFTGEVHRDKLNEFHDLMAEMLVAPRLDADDFERLREEQLNFLSKSLRGNDDESLGKWTLQLSLYPDHPYGHVDAGTVAGLKSITLADVKAFYQRHFSPESARPQLGVAGGADEAFVDKLRSNFDKSDRPVQEIPLPAPRSLKGLELTIVQKECIATAISIGFPVDLTRAQDDFYALAVANSAFGEHRTFNGRLMKHMRGLRGLNYGDYAYIENFIQDGGSTFPIPNIPRRQQYFSIWIRPVPHDKSVFALRQAVRELELLVEHGLTASEFEATRAFLRNYSKLWVQSQSRRLGYAMDGVFYGRASLIDELEQTLPALTRDQVNAAIRKYLQSQNLSVVVVTQDAAGFKEAVLSGKPSPLQYDTAGTPESILAEDKLIESYPLDLNRDHVRIVPVEEMFEK